MAEVAASLSFAAGGGATSTSEEEVALSWTLHSASTLISSRQIIRFIVLFPESHIVLINKFKVSSWFPSFEFVSAFGHLSLCQIAVDFSMNVTL
jgi:hypothetical protein